MSEVTHVAKNLEILEMICKPEEGSIPPRLSSYLMTDSRVENGRAKKINQIGILQSR